MEKLSKLSRLSKWEERCRSWQSLAESSARAMGVERRYHMRALAEPEMVQ